MVLLLAKQAVQIKCGFENARMTGNYELAYALGILTAAAGIEKVTEYESMIDLKKKILDRTDTFSTEEPRLKKMIELLQDYEPSDVFDEQMMELYDLGVSDKKV